MEKNIALALAVAWLMVTIVPSGQAVCQLNGSTQESAMVGDAQVPTLKELAHRLQRVHQGEFKKVIPLRVRAWQTQFKHRLREFIGGTLNETPEEMPTQLRRGILHRLRSMKIFEGFKEYGPNYTYGHVLDVTLTSVPHHQDMLAVAVIIDANWDEDESLYIFQRRGVSWSITLAAEVNGYSQVPYAQSSRFNYAISPPAADGSWFLVTSSVNPHKTSAWQHVTYTAWAPGPDADHARILVRRTRSIYLGGSEDESHACKINVTEKGFRVGFVLGFWNYSPAKERYSDEYSIRKDVARRVAVLCRTRNIMGRPIACSTRDRNYMEDVEKNYEIIKHRTPR